MPYHTTLTRTTTNRRRSRQMFFQPKLKVNTPGDAHGQEADQVASQVMRMQDEEVPVAQRMPLTPVNNVQRKCTECEEKEKEEVQRTETAGGKSGGQTAPPVVSQVLSSGGGRPIDAGTRQFMESRFGQDFGQVRIHTDGLAAESAAAIQAKAYTSGKNIVFGAGEYRPESSEGRRLLAHELAHVGQQNERQVKRAPLGEMWDAFWDAGPIDSYRANKLADESLSAAKKKSSSLPGGSAGLHNGHADAWRHCYWNCRMVQVIGKEDAAEIANNHEKHGGNALPERIMDEWNNEAGRSCSGDCDKCCEGKLYAKKLWILYDNNTKVGASNPQNVPTPVKPAPVTGGKYDKY